MNSHSVKLAHHFLSSIPSEIVTGVGQQRIEEHVAAFPSSMFEEMIGLETRLGDDDPSCDFFVSVQPNRKFSTFLIERGRQPRASQASKGLAWYLQEISRSNGFLSQRFAGAILEYDIARNGVLSRNEPGVFLTSRIPPKIQVKGAQEFHASAHGQGPVLYTATLAAACGNKEDEDVNQRIEALYRHFERFNCRSRHIGAFPSRDPPVMRLNVSLPTDSTLEFLTFIDWPGPLEKVEFVLNRLRTLVPNRIYLAMDLVSNVLTANLGLEIFNRRRGSWPLRKHGDWDEHFKLLVSDGLCTSGKASAIRRLPMQTRHIDQKGIFIMRLGLSHVKISVNSDQMSAKGYIGGLITQKQ